MTSMAGPTSGVAAAGAWIGARLVAVSAAVQRVQTKAVPVEAVPSAWRPVGVMAKPGDEVLAPVAAAAEAAAAPRVSPKRGPARSIKSGPPKAPRTRTAPVAVPIPASAAPAVVATGIAVAREPAAIAQSPAAIAEPPAAAAPAAEPAAATAVMEPTAPSSTVVVEPIAPTLPDDAVPVMDTAFGDAPTERVALPPVVLAMPLVQAPDKRRVIDPGHSPGVERASSTLAQRIGDDAERLAAIRLEALGWRIVGRNLRFSRAEIDLLAIDPADPPHLVIVEVRHRSRRDFGLAEETVDHRKRAALRRAAGELAIRPVLPDGRRLPNLPVRIDLVAIDRGPDGRPSLRHHRGIEV
jgi:Holliday junction resolvase-like predicted endonuclease